MSIQEQLFHPIAEAKASSSNKVSIVGIGAVGMATAFSILAQVRFKISYCTLNLLSIQITSILECFQ